MSNIDQSRVRGALDNITSRTLLARANLRLNQNDRLRDHIDRIRLLTVELCKLTEHSPKKRLQSALMESAMGSGVRVNFSTDNPDFIHIEGDFSIELLRGRLTW